MGGGNIELIRDVGNAAGLSPRGRGKQITKNFLIVRSRSIPAWAGETVKLRPKWSENGVYPRVGGGNGQCEAQRSVQKGLSPRGRGKLLRRREYPALVRSIPAWAGETN